MAITLKTDQEIDRMAGAGFIVSTIIAAVTEKCIPGVSTQELNDIAVAELEKHASLSAFLNYVVPGAPPYPGVVCTSINDTIVHGIPNKNTILKDGDIVGIDFACFKGGWCADAAKTVAVGIISPEKQKLIDTTKQCLDLATELCRPGKTLGDIGHIIRTTAETAGFSVVKNYSGHGIGKAMHEAPSVPNFGSPGTGVELREGMVIAIEPMLNIGSDETVVDKDGWTVKTKDGKDSAHFEHSIAITKNGPYVLTI